MKRRGFLGLVLSLLSSAAAAAQEPVQVLPSATGPISIQAAPVEYGFDQPGDSEGPTWRFNAEHLLWWTKSQPLPVPVLMALSDTPDLLAFPTLNTPGVTVLLGGEDPFDHQLHQGGRFTAGTFFGSDKRIGIEGSYFFLGQRTDNRSFHSDGSAGTPFLGKPYALIDAAGATTETSLALAFPGVIADRTTLDMRTFLQGAEINGLFILRSSSSMRIDLIAGGRYLDLEESLTLSSISSISPTIRPRVSDFEIIDEFSTRNQFYGGQLGARFEVNRGRFFVNGTGKVALGRMHQEVNANGLFRLTQESGVTVTPSGFYTQPSNIGEKSRDEFAVVPEGNLTVGFKLRDNIRVSAGYSFLWASNVLRPGDQIDRVINLSQGGPLLGGRGELVGPGRPVIPFNESSFWAQGANLGFEIRF